MFVVKLGREWVVEEVVEGLIILGAIEAERELEKKKKKIDICLERL
jgi:hypothetical protein